MRLQFLDRIEEEGASCLLCKTSLKEYIEAVPDDFQEFFVQRGIVANKFLDQLWDTLIQKKHIPTIVIVADQQPPNVAPQEEFVLQGGFKVLDGLQRTNRLDIIWNTISFLEEGFEDEPSESEARLARKYSPRLKSIGCAPSLFIRILKHKRQLAGLERIGDLFDHNFIWIETWFNLNESQQVKKMLILNAGHKAVNIKHQIELLFIEYLDVLRAAMPDAEIYREKDMSTTRYAKSRKPGDFHFAHLISAFESLASARPITTNSDFSAAKSFEGESAGDSDDLLQVDLDSIQAFARTIDALDKALQSEAGTNWLGREVVLVGLFAAIGKHAQENYGSTTQGLDYFIEQLDRYVDALDLASFEAIRNSLELSKVNIGNKNKMAVFKATLDFLDGRTEGALDWRKFFGVQ